MASIGYTWFRPSGQRTPINTEAKLLMMTHAFEQWQVRAVRLQTDARNARSRAAIERLGLFLDGVIRADRPGADGAVRDSAVFSHAGHRVAGPPGPPPLPHGRSEAESQGGLLPVHGDRTRHLPGTPFSRCSPRSVKASPLLTTEPRNGSPEPDTSTSPGPARADTRAARCARPTRPATSLPRSSIDTIEPGYMRMSTGPSPST